MERAKLDDWLALARSKAMEKLTRKEATMLLARLEAVIDEDLELDPRWHRKESW